MKQVFFEIIENSPLRADVMRLRLRGDCSAIERAGQFVNIKVEGQFLRRPLSVCDVDVDVLTVCYQIKGHGTEKLAAMQSGTLDLLTGLGNGFDKSLAGDRPLLIGGGMGFTPMYILAKELISMGKKPTVILGFNTKSEVIYEHEFKALGADVTVCTADGSYGEKGFVTDVMEGLDYSHFYTCGPEAMFKAICDLSKTSGQCSFEARMGCGFGACMGCSCETLYGTKRICKDGPVLMKEEIIWPT
ncbi:MAG: dihydroorotate dehydrogenase electron transfer subunit [Oscillospiraceae bacterium]|nr:dihydroorotate dehydrogenase electron transfer subunit [Oscillospiraceae bacterium]